MHAARALPRAGERIDEFVDDALQRVRAFGGIGQVARAQGAREFVIGEKKVGHGKLLDVEAGEVEKQLPPGR
jgi:hypothetical protein